MKGLIFIARKYKQVHRKEIDFDIKDWEKIEKKAAECHVSTSQFIRNMALNGTAYFPNMEGFAPLLNGMRIISNNVNQVAKKANETNNIYAEDVERLKVEVSQLSHTLNTFVSTLTCRKV